LGRGLVGGGGKRKNAIALALPQAAENEEDALALYGLLG
jgi:hypothetical protein